MSCRSPQCLFRVFRVSRSSLPPGQPWLQGKGHNDVGSGRNTEAICQVQSSSLLEGVRDQIVLL